MFARFFIVCSLMITMQFAIAETPGYSVATVLSPAKPLPHFELTDDTGKPFTEKNLQGHWSIVFFGFTSCPMICPTTMTTLKKVSDTLRKKVSDTSMPEVVMISVDPKRDTVVKMRDFVHRFDPHFRGVTGEEKNITALTESLGILFLAFKPNKNSEDYTVDHSNTLLMINPDGQLIAIFSAPHDANIIADDYQKITPGA